MYRTFTRRFEHVSEYSNCMCQAKMLGEQLGYGACNACDCRGYRPNDPKNDYCRDCGHSWWNHEYIGE